MVAVIADRKSLVAARTVTFHIAHPNQKVALVPDLVFICISERLL